MYYFYFYNFLERTNMSTKAPNIIDMVTDCANDTSHNPYSHFAKIILKGYLDGQPGKVATIYDLLASGRVNGNLVTRSTFIQVGELLESGIAVVGESSYRLESIISLLNDEEASLNEDDYGKPGVKFWSIFTVQLSTSFYRAFDIAKRNAAKRKGNKPIPVGGAPTAPPVPTAEVFGGYTTAVRQHFTEAAKAYVAYWNAWVDKIDEDTIVYLISLINMFYFERLYMQAGKAFNGVKVSRLKYAACSLDMSDELYTRLGIDANAHLSAVLDINFDNEKRTVMYAPSREEKEETAKIEFIDELVEGCNVDNFLSPVNQVLYKLWSNPLISVRMLLKFMEPICGIKPAVDVLVKLLSLDVIDLVKENGNTRKAKSKGKIITLLSSVSNEALLQSGEWDKHGLFLSHEYHHVVESSVPPGFTDSRPKPPQKSFVADNRTIFLGGAEFPRDKAVKFHRLLVLRKQLEEEERASGLPEWFRNLGFDYTTTWDRIFELITEIEKTGCIPAFEHPSDEKPLPSIE